MCLTPSPTFVVNQHEFRTYQHAVKHEAPDYEKFRPYYVWLGQCGYCSEIYGTVYPMVSLLTQYIPYEKALKI